MSRPSIHHAARGLCAALALALAVPAIAAPQLEQRDSDASADRAPTDRAPTDLPALPEGLASFGAAVAGDALYVFGGHIGQTHQHSVDNLSHHFRRLDLGDPASGWQELGEVAGLQGLPLVAYSDRVCRIGGLTAHNAADAEKEDLESLAEVACYDSVSGAWALLPPLPTARSSHDAVVLGDSLYVVGGWQLRGAGNESVWHDDLLVLDLAAAEPAWRSVPQPFERRALAVAAAGGKVIALGGLSTDGTSNRVDVFDPVTETWSQGPDLPLPDGLKGFGLSAFGIDDAVWLSGADGQVHALKVGAMELEWVLATSRLDQPRFFHRLLAHRNRLLFVGGASREGHLADIEVLALPNLGNHDGDYQKAAAMRAEQVAFDRGDWPGFRGLGDAQVPFSDMPLHWSDEDGVAWRKTVPGYGQSAPVVWDGQVFVTSVLGKKKEALLLSAYDLESGEVLWRRRFPAGLEIDNTDMVSRGAPTPVADAERLYVLWESGDLVALDHDGETLWRRSLAADYGPFEGNHGIGSSLVRTHDAVVAQVTHAGPSYFVTFDQRSGEVLWKADREPGVAWTTPVVVEGASGQELVASYAGHVEALDAASGQRLWHFGGIEKNNVPSVTVDGDRILVASSDPGHNFVLRRGVGELGPEQVLWRATGVTSGFGSPVFHGGCALFVNRSGVVTCVDRDSGEERWTRRLPGAVWAAPLAAGDHVYFFTKEGTTAVLRHDESGAELVAENPLTLTDTLYGVAAVRGAFLVRSGTELVHIGSGLQAGQPKQEQRTPGRTARGGKSEEEARL